LGFSKWSLMVLVAMQLMLMNFSWQELHFKIFHYNTCFLGTVEGQVLVMFMHLLVGGLSLFSLEHEIHRSLESVVPGAIGSLFAGLFGKPWSYISSLPLSAVSGLAASSLIGGMMVVDIIRALCRMKENRGLAFCQLMSFATSLGFQILFLRSGVQILWPLWTGFLVSVNTGIICVGVLVSSVCQMKYSPFQWSLVPFYLVTFLEYCVRGSPNFALFSYLMLLALSLWDLIFLWDFLSTLVNDICEELNIACFSLPKNEATHKNEALQKGEHKSDAPRRSPRIARQKVQ